MERNLNRLVLGTVQFGQNYGIANILGKPDQTMANAIVAKALNNNICEFDTAQGYGDSEIVLGQAIVNYRPKNGAKIISKLSVELDSIVKSSLQDKIFSSIQKLQVEQLYGLMLHRQEQLEMWDNVLESMLSEFQKKGLVQHLGVSVYTPERALQALHCKNLNMIQVPTNIFDKRFLDAGVFETADRLNKTIYIRSVFLQGLLLMENIPKKMAFAFDFHQKLILLASELGISVCELALWYVRDVFPKAKVVIGVDSPDQLRRNIDYWNDNSRSIDWESIILRIGIVPERIINPVLW